MDIKSIHLNEEGVLIADAKGVHHQYYSEIPEHEVEVELPEAVIALLAQIHEQLTKYPGNSKTLATVVSGQMDWRMRKELNDLFEQLGWEPLDFPALIENFIAKARTVKFKRGTGG